MDSITKQNIMAEAKAGDRVVWTSADGRTKKILYPGLGNRAGLHSYLLEAIGNVWKSKGGLKLQEKLDALTEGSVAVERFFNITRDLGRWFPIEVSAVAAQSRTEIQRAEHRQYCYDQASGNVVDLQRKRAKSRAKKGMGSFPSGW